MTESVLGAKISQHWLAESERSWLCWDASAALAARLRTLWDCGQRRRVAGTDVGEVAEVDGGDRDDRQPFAHRDHGGGGAA